MGRKKRVRKKREKPIRYGITWDSKLELNHYEVLKDTPFIEIVELQKTFQLFDGFKYKDFPNMKERRYARAVYTPDFIIKVKGIDKPIAFESKGFARDVYNYRKKMFIMKFGDQYYHWECGSVKQLREQLEELKEKLGGE